MSNISTACSEAAFPSAKVPWITFLFLFIVFFVVQHDLFISLLSDTKFQPSAELSATATVQGNLVRRVAFLMLGIFGLIGLMREPRTVFKIYGFLGWLILFFLAWSFLSIAWAEEITLILRKLIVLAMLWLGILAVSKRFSLRDIIWFVLFSTSLYLIIGLSAELALGTFHPIASGYRFSGTLHPNQQGINCALLFLSGIAASQTTTRGRKYFLACALIGLFFLILTRSRTPFACAMAALFVHWSLVSSRSHKFAFILVVGFTFCLFMLLSGGNILSSLRQGVLLGRYDHQNTYTLTGRVPLWEECLKYVKRRPLLGYGYGSFWTPRHIREITDAQVRENLAEQAWGISGACSVYIEFLLGLGIVGLVAYVLILIVGIIRSFVYYKAFLNADYAFLWVLLMFCMLDGLLESGFVDPGLTSFLMWLALVRLSFLSPFESLDKTIATPA
jgi:O-antigen ligase